MVDRKMRGGGAQLHRLRLPDRKCQGVFRFRVSGGCQRESRPAVETVQGSDGILQAVGYPRFQREAQVYPIVGTDARTRLGELIAGPDGLPGVQPGHGDGVIGGIPILVAVVEPQLDLVQKPVAIGGEDHGHKR